MKFKLIIFIVVVFPIFAISANYTIQCNNVDDIVKEYLEELVADKWKNVNNDVTCDIVAKQQDNTFVLAYNSSVGANVLSTQNVYDELEALVANMISEIQQKRNEFSSPPNKPYRNETNLTQTSTSTKPIAEKQPVSNMPSSVEYVDLGVSALWATCNVGASKPEEFGNYYTWGSKTPKSYSSSNSIYTDKLPVLPPSADAATFTLGSKWRMPTDAEWNELCTCCNWKWTIKNGVYGYEVSGIKYGYTDNSIFLPAAGFIIDEKEIDMGYIGCYWSSTLFAKNKNCAWSLSFTSKKFSTASSFRVFGLTIRPVVAR